MDLSPIKTSAMSLMKRCFELEPLGFNLKIKNEFGEDTKVTVTHIKSAIDNGLHQKYSNYGIALLRNSDENSPSFSIEENLALHTGQPVYYIEFSEEEGDFIEHEGCISALVQDENNIRNFKIAGDRVSTYPVPIVVYDEENQSLKIAGFAAKETADSTFDATHIEMFKIAAPDPAVPPPEEMMRAPGVLVTVTSLTTGHVYHGQELSKGGKGPRSMVITGNNLNKTYYLGNVHKLPVYKTKGEVKFYKKVLNDFINCYEFPWYPLHFTCPSNKKNPLIAIKDDGKIIKAVDYSKTFTETSKHNRKYIIHKLISDKDGAFSITISNGSNPIQASYSLTNCPNFAGAEEREGEFYKSVLKAFIEHYESYAPPTKFSYDFFSMAGVADSNPA